jgi:hypothetical protein
MGTTSAGRATYVPDGAGVTLTFKSSRTPFMNLILAAFLQFEWLIEGFDLWRHAAH